MPRLFIREDTQVRRLLQIHCQGLLQRAVKNRIAVVLTKSATRTESFPVRAWARLERRYRPPATSAATPTATTAAIFPSGRAGTASLTGCAASLCAELLPARASATRVVPEVGAASGVEMGTDSMLCRAARPESVSRFSRCRSALRSPA